MQNVLITSAGKRVALVRAFKETLTKHISDGKVFTTDLNPQMAPACHVSDKALPICRCTEPEYITELLTYCQKYGIGLVIPTIDTELLTLAQAKEQFARFGITIAVPDTDFVTLCRDKRNTEALLRKHGIAAPEAIDPREPRFPMFAKPYDGSLSTNIHRIFTPEELTPALIEDPKLMFMEYVDPNLFAEYTCDMYYGADNQLKCLVPRRRIEIRAGEINKGITEKGYLLQYLTQHLGHLNGCIGSVCLQVFYNPQNSEVKAIEINPRFGGGYPLSYAAGANYPDMLIREYFLGQKLEYHQDWQANKIMLRYDDAVFI